MDEAVAGLPKADRLALADVLGAVNQGFASAMAGGVAPGSAQANALAERHLAIGRRLIADYDHRLHRNFGRRLVTKGELRDPYEWTAPGLARYVRDVIVANAEHEDTRTPRTRRGRG